MRSGQINDMNYWVIIDTYYYSYSINLDAEKERGRDRERERDTKRYSENHYFKVASNV